MMNVLFFMSFVLLLCVIMFFMGIVIIVLGKYWVFVYINIVEVIIIGVCVYFFVWYFVVDGVIILFVVGFVVLLMLYLGVFKVLNFWLLFGYYWLFGGGNVLY